MKWTQKSFIKHIRHVWYDHGNLFSSRVREEMDGDQRAMELVDQFEDSWRELHDYVLQEMDDHEAPKITREELKEKLKPFVRKELRRLRS